MTLDLQAFHMDHLQHFEAREDIMIDVANSCKEMFYDSQIMMFSVLHKNHDTILIIVLQFIKSNVGEITVYPSKDFISGAPFLKEFFLKSDDFLYGIMNELELSRLQASIDISEPSFVTWIEGFGFEREGIMKHYGGDGKDYYLYGYGGGR